jgi:hypothetical protein
VAQTKNRDNRCSKFYENSDDETNRVADLIEISMRRKKTDFRKID